MHITIKTGHDACSNIMSWRHSQIAVLGAQDAAKQLSAAKAELDKHSERLAEAEQGITQVMGELERLSAKRTHLRYASATVSLTSYN